MLDDYEILGLWDLYDKASAPGTAGNRYAVSVIYMPIETPITLPYAIPLLVRAKHADAEPLVTEQMGREIDALLTEAAEQMTEDQIEDAFEEIHYWCATFNGRYDVWPFALPEKDALLNEYDALIFGHNADYQFSDQGSECGDAFFYRVPASDAVSMTPMSYCFTAYDARTFENLPLQNDRIEIVVMEAPEDVTGIENVENRSSLSRTLTSSPSYNLQGQKVSDSYRGIVIKNGRKFFKR